MVKLSAPTTINPTSSYLTGRVVPTLLDEHTTDKSLCEEFTTDEAHEVDFTGIAAEMNHQGAVARVGRVVGYRADEGIEALIELPASSNVASILAKALLFNGHYRDVSLGHSWRRCASTGQVTKTAIEVSLCVEGARTGSHITEFYPSLNLLRCQPHPFLAAFAQRYNYAAPPPLPDVAPGNLLFADAQNTPALDAYTRDVLWPQVHARRQRLLKLSGYIAASKSHKASRHVEQLMESLPTLAVAAAQLTAPVSAGAAAVTSPPVANQLGDAMAEDGDVAASRAAMLQILKQNQDELERRLREKEEALAKKEEALVKASADAETLRKQCAEQELARQEAEHMTRAAALIDNCDAYDDEQRTTLKDNFKTQLAMFRQSAPDQRRQMIDLQLEGLRQCSVASQTALERTQARKKSIARGDFFNEEERRATLDIVQRSIAAKNAERISQRPPLLSQPIAPTSVLATSQSTSSFETIDESSDAQRPTKRGVAAVGTQGVVTASRASQASVTSEPVETFISPHTDGWAGKAFAESIQAQSGEKYVTVPSVDDLARGGFVRFETGVVRKSRGADGQIVTMRETDIAHRFEQESHPITLQALSPAVYNDLIKSCSTNVMFLGGKATSMVPSDPSTFSQLIATAQEAENKFASRRDNPLAVRT